MISPSPPRSSSPRVVIQGDQVAAVKDYCKWLESQWSDETYKADFRKAPDVVLKRWMDLELILENSNPGFFTDGIEIGTALRFTSCDFCDETCLAAPGLAPNYPALSHQLSSTSVPESRSESQYIYLRENRPFFRVSQYGWFISSGERYRSHSTNG
ncbi:hypothetical protein BJX63DRAFT_416962 [Aspergillus granulosus]|uniref:Uncharacterized protein n=1 Tax=Aspergillus granulosus TaxID=176169 RepID=A0ABR4GT31_9EURO